MLFFTSDLHLNHENAIEYTNRPFSCLDEMNQELIRKINERVGSSDTLWILGDFAYKASLDEIRGFRQQIKCRNVNLVYGNHDKKADGAGIFQSVQDYKVLKSEYGPLVLFHYPILDWYAKHYGSIHLHGHIHSTDTYNENNLAKMSDDQFAYGHTSKQAEMGYRIYDVGVDANNYQPVSIEEIAKLMNLPKISTKNAI